MSVPNKVIVTPAKATDRSGNQREMHTAENADLWLYTLNMDEPVFRAHDREQIAAFTEDFGEHLWKRAIILLSFANKVAPDCWHASHEHLDPMEANSDPELTSHFERTLAIKTLKIRSMIKDELKKKVSLDEAKRIAANIPVLPAGLTAKAPQEEWTSTKLEDMRTVTDIFPVGSSVVYRGQIATVTEHKKKREIQLQRYAPSGSPNLICVGIQYEGEDVDTVWVSPETVFLVSNGDIPIPLPRQNSANGGAWLFDIWKAMFDKFAEGDGNFEAETALFKSIPRSLIKSMSRQKAENFLKAVASRLKEESDKAKAKFDRELRKLRDWEAASYRARVKADKNACFHENATVSTIDPDTGRVSTKQMYELRPFDVVLGVDGSGRPSYSPIFWIRRQRNTTGRFLEVTMANASSKLSSSLTCDADSCDSTSREGVGVSLAVVPKGFNASDPSSASWSGGIPSHLTLCEKHLLPVLRQEVLSKYLKTSSESADALLVARSSKQLARGLWDLREYSLAESLRAGDWIWVTSSEGVEGVGTGVAIGTDDVGLEMKIVSDVRSVRRKGLYIPITKNPDIVVDGAVASVWSHWFVGKFLETHFDISVPGWLVHWLPTLYDSLMYPVRILALSLHGASLLSSSGMESILALMDRDEVIYTYPAVVLALTMTVIYASHWLVQRERG